MQKRPTAPEAQLRLCVPPDPRLGGYVRQELNAFARLQGIEPESVTDFISAIGEALANAIEHSHSRKPIDVVAWMLGDDRLFASIQDHGVGFAPCEGPLADKLPDAYAERGRGLPIMRRYADVLSVRSTPGEGTRVTLGCRIRTAAGNAEHAAG